MYSSIFWICVICLVKPSNVGLDFLILQLYICCLAVMIARLIIGVLVLARIMVVGDHSICMLNFASIHSIAFSQKILTISHVWKRWMMVSSSCSQRSHRLFSFMPHLCSWLLFPMFRWSSLNWKVLALGFVVHLCRFLKLRLSCWSSRFGSFRSCFHFLTRCSSDLSIFWIRL